MHHSQQIASIEITDFYYADKEYDMISIVSDWENLRLIDDWQM